MEQPLQNKVIKLQLEADDHTFAILDGQSRICNWLYNYLLAHAEELKKIAIETGNFEEAKIIYTKHGLRNLIPILKEEHAFLKTVHSSPFSKFY